MQNKLFMTLTITIQKLIDLISKLSFRVNIHDLKQIGNKLLPNETNKL